MLTLLLRLVLWLLRNNRLKPEARALVMNTLLESVQALPIADLIAFDLQGTVQVRGKKLDTEQAMVIREGAVSLEKNPTYRLIKEQIAFEAVKMGVHSSLTLDMVLFAKAALWIQQQEIKLIGELKGEAEEVV